VQFLWRHGGPVPAAVVSLARIDALKVCVRDRKNAIRLGAALPLSDIEHQADVRRECPRWLEQSAESPRPLFGGLAHWVETSDLYRA
jgi:CO/xanthine dehydrogenase FAD-binding subunit